MIKKPSLDIQVFIIPTLVTAIFIFALVMRIGMVNLTKLQVPIQHDSIDYYSYAINLKTVGIYSHQNPVNVQSGSLKNDHNRMPGYSLFLLPFVENPPTNKMVHNIVNVQALIGGLTVLLSFFLFRLFLTLPLSISGMTLVAMSPHLIVMDIYILTESLFTFFLVSLAYCMAKLVLKQNKLWAYFLGFTLGICLLIKPTISYFLIFLIPGIYFLLKKNKSSPLILILLAGYLTSYGPWIVYKQLNPVEKPSTLTLRGIQSGTYIGLMYENDPQSRGKPQQYDKDYNKIKDIPSLLTKLSNQFQQQPVKYLKWYFIDKPIMFFSWNIIVGMGGIFVYYVLNSPYNSISIYYETYKIMHLLHGPLMVMGAITILFLWLPPSKNYLTEKTLLVSRILSTIIFYFIAVHIAVNPLPRYSIPLRPLMYAFALLGILLFYRMIKKRATSLGCHK